jgi:hypothetical protein
VICNVKPERTMLSVLQCARGAHLDDAVFGDGEGIKHGNDQRKLQKLRWKN